MLASIDILGALELVAYLYFMRHIKLLVRRACPVDAPELHLEATRPPKPPGPCPPPYSSDV